MGYTKTSNRPGWVCLITPDLDNKQRKKPFHQTAAITRESQNQMGKEDCHSLYTLLPEGSFHKKLKSEKEP